ncbi:uncharacterized protein DFL_004340 [Arthrobotrys flagrans]|uniref:Uncharacterized protein n=1 Tax=Arthrobotrys flagrans TaxID=97331 RepID=A0A437A4J5_ARTFL|nr:hypothetical protein DFL_004340 [Arthrobotrys flagrans]
MPRLTAPQLESILIQTPPNPEFTLLIDQLMKMDSNLAKNIKRYRDDKDTQIVIIMQSETEYIFNLLKDGKIDEAMKARYRLLFCAEVERQKLAAYEATTREQLIARFTTLSNDIVELSKLILNRKTNLEIHNHTNQLWFIDGLKREVLKGDNSAIARLKAIELPKENWQTYLSSYTYRPHLKKQASASTKLDTIPEIKLVPEQSVKEPENPSLACETKNPPVSTTPTASGMIEQSKETLPEAEPEAQPFIVPKEGGLKREGSFGKRTVANFQHRWRKLQTKFGTSTSDDGEQITGDGGQIAKTA